MNDLAMSFYIVSPFAIIGAIVLHLDFKKMDDEREARWKREAELEASRMEIRQKYMWESTNRTGY